MTTSARPVPRRRGRQRAGRPLLCLVHITDLQLADVQSPTRFEFLNRYFADPRYADIVPVQRPQEALTAHAVDAMLRTLNAARGPATGAPLHLAVTTGDAIDNAQWNEVQAFLALFDGGLVATRLRRARLQRGAVAGLAGRLLLEARRRRRRRARTSSGATSASRTTRVCWSARMREFSAAGLSAPWLSCFGNHEALNQGVGAVDCRASPSALIGTGSRCALPEDFDHDGR